MIALRSSETEFTPTVLPASKALPIINPLSTVIPPLPFATL